MAEDVIEPLVNFEQTQRQARLSNIRLTIKAYVLSLRIKEENNHD